MEPSHSRSPTPKGLHDRSPSRGSHQHARSQQRQRTSMTEGRPVSNIFSDEFSLEPLDEHVSPVSPVASSRTSTSTRSSADGGRPPHASPFGDSSEVLPLDDIPSTPVDPSQRHARSDTSSVAPASSSASSMVESRTPSVAQRSVSTSSRFSMPRAMSPYRGQTGPSHPYAMYPQGTAVNHTSSLSSTSTVRPGERTPVAAPPPQHPYAMYSQNTVPEEVPDEPQQPDPSISLGLPVGGGVYPNNPRQAQNELGDIVGPDGHTEQLPPYSRYPDALPPKQDLSDNLAATSDETPVSPDSGVSSRSLVAVPEAGGEAGAGGGGGGGGGGGEGGENQNENADDDASGGLKEKITRTGRRRVCCGFPIWMFLVCGAVLVFGAVIGGVVGGLLGTQQGAKDAAARESSSPTSTSEPKATVTVTAGSTLDATPLSAEISQDLPIAPTGSYKLGTSQLTDESNACVDSDQFSESWQCRDTGVLSYSIYRSDGSNTISLHSYDLETNFIYGAQGPIFHKTRYQLYLKQDKTRMSLGPALFFYAPFDKLVIIREENFPYVSSRRSIDAEDLSRLALDGSGDVGQIGDKPWFCWWNATYLEAFFYINETSSPEVAARGDEASHDRPSRTTPVLSETELADGVDSESRRRWTFPVKAEESSTPYYPRALRFAEKRLSQNGYPPYCEQMQIMENGSITGPLAPAVTIRETDTESGPSVTGQYPDIKAVRRRSNTDSGGNETCHCEWFVP